MLDFFLLQASPVTANSNWFLDKLLPSLIGSGTALLVFYLTTRRDRSKEQKKRQDEREDRISYLKSLLNSIVQVATLQRDNLANYVRKITDNPVDFHLLTSVPLTDFVRAIEVLNKEDYYSAFNKHYKNKINAPFTFNRIISNVDYLHVQFLAVQDMLKKSQQFDYKRKLLYKTIVDRAINTTGNLLIQRKESMPPIFKQMDEILFQFMQGLTDPSNLPYHDKKFVVKMDELLVSYLLSAKETPNELLVLEADTREAKGLFQTIIKANLLVADDINEIYKQVRSVLTELETHVGAGLRQ